MRGVFLVVGLGCLVACSGDDNGSAGEETSSVPTLTVTLDKTSQSQPVSDLDSRASLSFTATYSGSTKGQIYPKVTFDSAVLALDGDVVHAGKSYTVRLKSLENLSAGARTGDVTFRLCRDPDCSVVYPGSMQTFSYAVDVKLADWAMFQRTAKHTGFVRASFDPQKIAKVWEQSLPNITGYQPVATSGDTVFVTRFSNAGGTSVQALNSATGAERWSYDIGAIHSASGPTVAGDQIQIVTMSTSSSNNRIVTLASATGTFVRNMLFAAQWSAFAQPTAVDRELYLASGYYGNVVYSYDLDQGTTRWTADGKSGRVWDGSTPAVDDQFVYYYSGSLDVFRRDTGALVKTITDPFWQWGGYSYAFAPILGSRRNAIAYSGTGGGAFPIVSYDIDAGQVAWRTANSYNVVPALANGILYAASNTQGQLDAIGEDDGKVRWSWPLPVGETFLGNIVATDNLLFFSTDKKIYAIALTGNHGVLWSASTPGRLAISADAKLIVSSVIGGSPSQQVLTAYSLQ